MRKIKQTAAFLLALVMLLGISVKASSCSIIIEETTEGSSSGAYVAYQLMTVTTGEDYDGNITYAYAINAKYSDVMRKIISASTDEAVISYINGLTDSSALGEFANALYKLILSEGLEKDAASIDNALTGLAPGYYLIAEAPDSVSSAANQVYSLVMLTTVSERTPRVAVYTKEAVPTLIKEVKEADDGDWDFSLLNSSYASADFDGWQDGADYDMGDSVPFRLTATPAYNFESYETYSMIFHDTLSEGLTFEADSVKVSIDGTRLDADDYVLTDNTLSGGGGSFSVKVTDLKSLQTAVTVSETSSVVVEYTAVLNTNANVGSAGNDNTAYLEYSNNPYGSGTGTTPEDQVRVFTFELQLDKVDSKGRELKGAGFRLYKEIAGENSSTWTEIGEERVGTLADPLSSFSWTGLDSGTYKLVETTVPDGYTKADDIFFTLGSDYETTSDDPALNELSVTVTGGTGSVYSNTATSSSGHIHLKVINTSGELMPTTGGAGTLGIYVSGGMLMLGAVILLVISRRGKRS